MEKVKFISGNAVNDEISVGYLEISKNLYTKWVNGDVYFNFFADTTSTPVDKSEFEDKDGYFVSMDVLESYPEISYDDDEGAYNGDEDDDWDCSYVAYDPMKQMDSWVYILQEKDFKDTVGILIATDF